MHIDLNFIEFNILMGAFMQGRFSPAYMEQNLVADDTLIALTETLLSTAQDAYGDQAPPFYRKKISQSEFFNSMVYGNILELNIVDDQIPALIAPYIITGDL
ncbi:hypothetical protein [Parasulfitobacter algicola]|uniref:Uncharacterized protein n=1 Tax=Parasulfitobacter algicola TaxID=2614809 RepID=A0ABX2IY58_9RHOB|nr:hypothetical protein [Sulfitobacter algicola]NSX56062.1 hypothetical protein [Sulfitobacter algicola]